MVQHQHGASNGAGEVGEAVRNMAHDELDTDMHVSSDWEKYEAELQELCCYGTVQEIAPIITKYPQLLRKMDACGKLPLHSAASNSNTYAWMIVNFLVERFPEGIRLADETGQLPLHIACRNEGPERVMSRDEVDSEEAAAEGANSFEMVKTLMERFPAGAMHRDMDGMLPIDWAVQNPGHGTLEVVKMLLEHYPEALQQCDLPAVDDDWRAMAKDKMSEELAAEAISALPDGVLENMTSRLEDLTPAAPTYQRDILGGHVSAGCADEEMKAFIARFRSAQAPAQDKTHTSGDTVMNIYGERKGSAMFRILAREYFVLQNGDVPVKQGSDMDSISPVKRRWQGVTGLQGTPGRRGHLSRQNSSISGENRDRSGSIHSQMSYSTSSASENEERLNQSEDGQRKNIKQESRTKAGGGWAKLRISAAEQPQPLNTPPKELAAPPTPTANMDAPMNLSEIEGPANADVQNNFAEQSKLTPLAEHSKTPSQTMIPIWMLPKSPSQKIVDVFKKAKAFGGSAEASASGDEGAAKKGTATNLKLGSKWKLAQKVKIATALSHPSHTEKAAKTGWTQKLGKMVKRIKVSRDDDEGVKILTEKQNDVLGQICEEDLQSLAKTADAPQLFQRVPFHLVCENRSNLTPQILSLMYMVEPSGALAKDSVGRLPLHVACANPSEWADQIVMILLQSDPEQLLVKDSKGQLPVHYLASNKGPKTGKIMQQLLAICPQCACMTACVFDENASKVVARSVTQADEARSVHLPARGKVVVEVPESGGELYLPRDAETGCEIRFTTRACEGEDATSSPRMLRVVSADGLIVRVVEDLSEDTRYGKMISNLKKSIKPVDAGASSFQRSIRKLSGISFNKGDVAESSSIEQDASLAPSMIPPTGDPRRWRNIFSGGVSANHEVIVEAPSDVCFVFVRRGRRWSYTVEGIETLPSELLLSNCSSGSAEALKCLLQCCPALAFVEDRMRGMLVHRLARRCVMMQSELDSLPEKDKHDKGQHMLRMLENILESAPATVEHLDMHMATPLHVIAETSCSWLSDVVQLMIRARPASAWHPDGCKLTPLHIAVQCDNIKAARTLAQREDTMVSQLIEDEAGNLPSDVAFGKQMRSVLSSCKPTRAEQLSLILTAFESLVMMVIWISILIDNFQDGDQFYGTLFLLCPLMWICYTSWEELTLPGLSGDERFLNTIITSCWASRMIWEAFRIVKRQAYISRFGCLDNPRSTEKNRLADLKQTEGTLILFPLAIILTLNIIARSEFGETDMYNLRINSALLVFTSISYAHSSAIIDGQTLHYGRARSVKQNAACFCFRLFEFLSRTATISLGLDSAWWIVVVICLISEWLFTVVSWTMAMGVSHWSASLVVKSFSNMVGAWETHPLDTLHFCSSLRCPKYGSKRRFLGDQTMQEGITSITTHTFFGLLMIVAYATAPEDNLPARRAFGADEPPMHKTLEICATVGLALRVAFAVVHKVLWNRTHRDTVQSQEEFETTRDAHTKDNEVVGRIAVRVVKARDLPNNESQTDTTDPYVLLECGAEHLQTKTVFDALNPRWDEHFSVYLQSFQVRGMISECQGTDSQLASDRSHYNKSSDRHRSMADIDLNMTLRVSVFDHDRLSSDDYLGSVEIPLKKLYTEGYIEGWHRLGSPSDSSGYHQGQVLLCMRMILWGEEDKKNPLKEMHDIDLASGSNLKQIAINSIPIPHPSTCLQLPAFDDQTVDFSALYGSTMMGRPASSSLKEPAMINTLGKMGTGSPLPSPLGQLRSPMMWNKSKTTLRRISPPWRSFEGRSPTLRSAASSPRKGPLQTQQLLWSSTELPLESADAPAGCHLVGKMGVPKAGPRLSPRSAQGSTDFPMKVAGSTTKEQTCDSSREQQQEQEQQESTSGTGRGSRDKKREQSAVAVQDTASPLGSGADYSPLESDNGGHANNESSDCTGESKDVGREERAIASHGVSLERREDGDRNTEYTRASTVRENGDGGAPREPAAIAHGGGSAARWTPLRPDGDIAIDTARAPKGVVDLDSPETGVSPSYAPESVSGIQGAHLMPPTEMAGEAAMGSMRMQEAQARVLADPVLAAVLQSGGPITPPTPLSKDDALWLTEISVGLVATPMGGTPVTTPVEQPLSSKVPWQSISLGGVSRTPMRPPSGEEHWPSVLLLGETEIAVIEDEMNEAEDVLDAVKSLSQW